MEISERVEKYRSWGAQQLHDAVKQVLSADGRDAGNRVIELNVLILALRERGLSVDPKLEDLARKGLDSMITNARLDAESRGVQVFDLGMPENLKLRFYCKKCGEAWSPEGEQSVPAGFKCPKCNS